MRLNTIRFNRERGWSVREFPERDSPHTLVVLFAVPSFMESPQSLAELLVAYPLAVILECSTAGEVFGMEIAGNSVSAGIICFDRTVLKVATARVASLEDSCEAERQITTHLHAPSLRSILVLPDGLHVNGSELARGVRAGVPPSVVVTGGLAGDGDGFAGTWGIQDRQHQGGYVTAVGFYGERIYAWHGSKGAWALFGPERRVTRSKGNVLCELDGSPALQRYKEFLDDHGSEPPTTGPLFPLAHHADRSDPKRLVRPVLAVNEAEQSLTFAGDSREGYLGQLRRANFDRLVPGAAEAAFASTSACTMLRRRSLRPSAVWDEGWSLANAQQIKKNPMQPWRPLQRGHRKSGFIHMERSFPMAQARAIYRP